MTLIKSHKDDSRGLVQAQVGFEPVSELKQVGYTRVGIEYQPKTGERCACRKGIQRDNCSACEGTGWKIDFAKIRKAHAR